MAIKFYGNCKKNVSVGKGSPKAGCIKALNLNFGNKGGGGSLMNYILFYYQDENKIRRKQYDEDGNEFLIKTNKQITAKMKKHLLSLKKDGINTTKGKSPRALKQGEVFYCWGGGKREIK